MSGCWSRGSCVGRATADDKLFMLPDRIIKSIIIIKITTTITTPAKRQQPLGTGHTGRLVSKQQAHISSGQRGREGDSTDEAFIFTVKTSKMFFLFLSVLLYLLVGFRGASLSLSTTDIQFSSSTRQIERRKNNK